MRKYSDAFIDRQIAKIDKMFEESIGPNLITTPNCLMPEDRWGGSSRLSPMEREEVKKYYRQLQNLSYVNGFWMGWTLREGLKENLDK